MYIVDEKIYQIGWRFNSSDCQLSDEEKRQICFLNRIESKTLWSCYFSINNLMELTEDTFVMKEKRELDFLDEKSGYDFFQEQLKETDVLFLFWSKTAAVIVKKHIFLKSWSDFFYPSDENSIIVIPNNSFSIFSFGDKFFSGTMKYYLSK